MKVIKLTEDFAGNTAGKVLKMENQTAAAGCRVLRPLNHGRDRRREEPAEIGKNRKTNQKPIKKS